MSKMSELAAEIAELKHCGEILIGISESLADLFLAPEEHTEKQTIKKTAAKKGRKAKGNSKTGENLIPYGCPCSSCREIP